ncbi:hypothetical protein T09_5241 [Trichinella sp. T9]|nr:hypothetical protein T09_5241 [Trichinella sp. T9]
MQIFIRVLCIGLRGVNCNGCCRTLCGMTNEAKQKKLKNTDNMQQIMNGTKQNKRRQQKSENADHTRQIEDDTKHIEDDTKQIEDDTKQYKRRQSSWDPNSVGLGLGYFERVKLSHINDQPTWLSFELMQYLVFHAAKFIFFILYIFDFVKTLTHEKHCIQISKHVTNHGRIMHMEKKVDKWRKPRSVGSNRLLVNCVRWSIPFVGQESRENFCLLNVLQSRHSRTCLSENVDVTLVSMIVGVRKSKNADHTKKIEDDRKRIEDDTKRIEDDTKRIEDDTKQNKRRQSSWDPNSVGLGLGYFKRSKQITDDTKRIADGTKQNKKRQKVYVVPRGSQFCRSGLGILRKGEVIP